MSRRLIYVVGPSGAGKDSVLYWLRKHLPATAPVHWARRTIDRPPSGVPEAEDHASVDTTTFAKMVNERLFAMHWDANGHRYGVPHCELNVLNLPNYCVMVNGSRVHLPTAAQSYPGLTVLHITADPLVLRERLIRRGRETLEAIEARLKRNIPLSLPSGCALLEVRNNATLEQVGQELMERLLADDF